MKVYYTYEKDAEELLEASGPQGLEAPAISGSQGGPVKDLALGLLWLGVTIAFVVMVIADDIIHPSRQSDET